MKQNLRIKTISKRLMHWPFIEWWELYFQNRNVVALKLVTAYSLAFSFPHKERGGRHVVDGHVDHQPVLVEVSHQSRIDRVPDLQLHQSVGPGLGEEGLDSPAVHGDVLHPGARREADRVGPQTSVCLDTPLALVPREDPVRTGSEYMLRHVWQSYLSVRYHLVTVRIGKARAASWRRKYPTPSSVRYSSKLSLLS